MSVELRRPSVTMQLIRYLTHRNPDCGRRCALRVPSCRQALHARTDFGAHCSGLHPDQAEELQQCVLRFLWFASRSEDVVIALSQDSVLAPLVSILVREAMCAASASSERSESAAVVVKVINNFAAASRNKLLLVQLGVVRPLLTFIACTRADVSIRTLTLGARHVTTAACRS